MGAAEPLEEAVAVAGRRYRQVQEAAVVEAAEATEEGNT